VIRLVVVLLLCAVDVHAQYTSLATDFSGATLYFTTSLRQSPEQPEHGKLFSVTSAGIVTPVLIRERVVERLGPGLPNSYTTNYYNLHAVLFASSGKALAVTGYRECSGVSSVFCGFNNRSDVYNDKGERVVTEADGFINLSPNGRWALSTGNSLTGISTLCSLYDLQSNIKHDLASVRGGRDRRFHDIADSGIAVQVAENQLELYVTNYLFRFALPALPSAYLGPAVIDAAGETVVHELGRFIAPHAPTLPYLRVVRIAPGFPARSLEASGFQDFSPAISDDGKTILFVSKPDGVDDPQVHTVTPDNTNRRKVTSEPEGILRAILSGSGRIAWAVTRTGRLLQIDLSSGGVLQVLGPTVVLHYAPLRGGSGEIITVSASVMPGDQVELHLEDGTPLRVLDIGVQRITFEVPVLPDSDERFHEYRVTIRRPDSDPAWMAHSETLIVSRPWLGFY
jgi:hypothetical protein